MYLGKEDGNVEYNLVWRVVKYFIVLIEDKFYNLYMDNFYCDLYFFLEFEIKKVFVCGIIRVNWKGFFKDFVIIFVMEKRLNCGDCLWRSYGNFVVMVWYDKCLVYLIFIIYFLESVGV